MRYPPLTREQLRSVIEGRGCADRVPILLHFWVNPDAFDERAPQVRAILERYPQDAQVIGLRIPDVFEAPPDDSEYRWVNYADPDPGASGAIDERVAISDWSRLDGILRDFPDAAYPGLLPWRPEPDGRYRIGHWWYFLFERHWQLRGMSNALMDYHLHPAETHRLFRALTDFYIAMMERAHTELGVDAILTSDDLGTQKGPFFSPKVFAEFYKPYYREVIGRAHELGMHFWLHCCGNIEPFLPDLIEIGLDVLHPIQKYTMDEAVIARRFGADLCIWSGFDVQQTIPWGSPEDVRAEVRHLIDTYFRPEGRLMLTAGNAVNGDCPVPSLAALFEESFEYGAAIAGRARG